MTCSLKKLNFSEEEDQLLASTVADLGVDDWELISTLVGRSRFDCLLRWHRLTGSVVVATKVLGCENRVTYSDRHETLQLCLDQVRTPEKSLKLTSLSSSNEALMASSSVCDEDEVEQGEDFVENCFTSCLKIIFRGTCRVCRAVKLCKKRNC